jgi:hypothetical protein
MAATAHRRPARRLLAAVAALALGIGGCTEVESAAVEGYEPAKLTEVDGSDRKLITFTQEGADRSGLQTRKVQRRGGLLAVPYESVIYSGEGTSYVYVSPKPLTYQRAEIAVSRITGPQALLTAGPQPGTDVVTVGATEVYGTELEIAGSH